MSCSDMPPPGFGDAAAGGQLLRRDFGGTKSAAHSSMMANVKEETDDGNLEVLQQSQMQNEVMASQSSCQNKSSLAGNKNTSPAKGPYKRSCADATIVASPGVNASNTGHDLHSCKRRKGPGQHDKSVDKEGTTGLRGMQTPINLFEDECIFCHSFRTSEFHGPMVQYRKGMIVSSNEGDPTNTIYVHKKCMDWAPQVYVHDDIIVNMEKEISRASRLKCSRCRLPGAALGCYHSPCAKTYHVPCAVMISECRWDIENHRVWCPKHASDTSPCDETSSPIMESNITFTIIQNLSSQCSSNEEISADCRMEDKQINSPVTSNFSLLEQVPSQYLNKPVMPVIHRREDRHVDQLNTLNSSFSQGQVLDKEGISADYRREEKQINQSRTPVDQWVLLSSVLSASEKDSLKKFASLTGSTLAEKWGKNVTHVIVGRSAGILCGRSYEVLMAILSGKWVVTAGWIMDCLAEPISGPKTYLAEPILVPEISYEVEFFDSSHTLIDGPKKGRAGAAKGAPKLFSGLYFCLSAYLNPEYRENIKNLIVAAGGQVLEAMSLRSLQQNLGKSPAKLYFIYDGGPPRDYASTLFVGKEIEEGFKYAASGAQVISHLSLFDAIASYDVRMLEWNYHSNPVMGVKTPAQGVALVSC